MPVTRDTVVDWMCRFAGEMEEHRGELVRLDSAIGDGDHGTNMDRGMRKALERLDSADQADAGAVLKAVAMALVSSVGGAAGPLYGTLFLQMGGGLAEGPRGRTDPGKGRARRQDDGRRAGARGGGDGAGVRLRQRPA